MCALVAPRSGAAVLPRREGTRSHRRIGWIHVGGMLMLSVTALMTYRLFGGFGPFHAGAILSLVTVAAGIIPAHRRKPASWIEHHDSWMTGSYTGLCAAAVAEVATRTPGFGSWWAVLVGSLAVIGVGARMIRRSRAAVLAPFRRAASESPPV